MIRFLLFSTFLMTASAFGRGEHQSPANQNQEQSIPNTKDSEEIYEPSGGPMANRVFARVLGINLQLECKKLLEYLRSPRGQKRFWPAEETPRAGTLDGHYSCSKIRYKILAREEVVGGLLTDTLSLGYYCARRPQDEIDQLMQTSIELGKVTDAKKQKELKRKLSGAWTPNLPPAEGLKCPEGLGAGKEIKKSEIPEIEQKILDASSLNGPEKFIYKRLRCSTLDWIHRWEIKNNRTFDPQDSDMLEEIYWQTMEPNLDAEGYLSEKKMSEFLKNELGVKGSGLVRSQAVAYALKSFDYLTESGTPGQDGKLVWREQDKMFEYGVRLLQDQQVMNLLQFAYAHKNTLCN